MVIDDHLLGNMFDIMLMNPFAAQLSKLVIRAKPITDVSLLRLCERLDEMEQLTYLDLSLCDISGTGIVKLAAHLPATNIKTLILSGNKLQPSASKV